MCDACFHRVLLLSAAVDTIIADCFDAFKALEYVIIIIHTIVIILLIRDGYDEPPNPSLRGLHTQLLSMESVIISQLFQPVI